MSNPERVAELSAQITGIADHKIRQINGVTSSVRMLALNALIEAQRAGEHGRGFAVVAQEVRSVSETITQIAAELGTELKASSNQLGDLGRQLVQEVRGARLTDLAYNAIEIIDRNLYERSCDVRWWATDSAVVEACADPAPERLAYACERLGVILNSYTVYLDLWIADARGRVIASGRSSRYPRTVGADVSREAWFTAALNTRSGGEFAAIDVEARPELGGALVGTYSTAVRAGGREDGQALGALGVFFDWGPQAKAVVDGVRLSEHERARSRVMLLDRDFRVIAASDDQGVLTERFPLRTGGKASGYYADERGRTVAFALTPGYETYQGLGWYGVITQG